MPKANSFGRGLDVVGHVDLTIDDIPCAISFEGDLIILALPRVKTALTLRKKLPDAARWLRDAEPWLNEAGLELAIAVGGRRIGRFGAGIAANWLAKMLGVAPFRIEPKELFAALFGLRPKGSPR